MKLTLLSAVMIVSGLVFVGCGKPDEPVAPRSEAGQNEMQGAVDQATAAVNETVEQATAKIEEVKQAAEASIAEAQAKVEAATAQFDELVAGIREQLAAKNFEQALAGVEKGFALPNLTGDQKGILQQLQEAIRAAMALNTATTGTGNVEEAAGEAAGGLLRKIGGR